MTVFRNLPTHKPAGVARGLLGRQRMVRADDLVAVGDVGARSQKQSSVVGHALKEEVRIAGHDLHVLGSDPVGLLNHLLITVADDDLAVVRPGDARDRGGRKDRQQAIDLAHRLARKRL